MAALAGVVVLFNPEKAVLENIRSYVADLDVLFAVDNSTDIDEFFLAELKNISNVRYFANDGNEGVARALNVGAREALAGGFRWLLTMDQDSRATENMLPVMRKYLQKTDCADVAILSPFQTNVKEMRSPAAVPVREVLTVMTSGNLLNLDIYQKIGPFLDILFIDSIDHEYCLRARKNGYRVLQINEAILLHSMGRQQVHFGGVIATHHPPFRYYFMIRNQLFVIRRYRREFPQYYWHSLKELLKSAIKVLLVEKDKWHKFYAMARGFRDSRLLEKRAGSGRKIDPPGGKDRTH